MAGQPPSNDRPPPPPGPPPGQRPSEPWSPPSGPAPGQPWNPPPGGPPPGPGGPPPSPGAWPSVPPGGAAPPEAPASGPWAAPPAGGYGYGAPRSGYNLPKAGWWSRLAALLIDGVIIGLFSIPAVIAINAGPTEIETCSVDESGDIQFGEPDNAICEVPTNGTIALTIVLGVAGAIAGIAYFAIMDGKRGATLGKQALGIRVADVTTGQPIGTGRGVGRWFARILSAIPCYLGYLWPLWDQQKQAFHDKIVSSVVVKS
ncbi:MAG TPA: RDD family protein [Acidimicrobiales bacterium]|nr:RDD family protein [Acidimicrobiales bacterium]